MMDKLILLEKLKNFLVARFGEDIREIILFGSRAAGTDREDSDYDVLIILNRDYDWRYRHNIISAIYELELEHDVFIDAKIISTQELHHTIKGKHPLYADAIREGIHA
jgi:predicted nucleotidyltransferase